MTAQQAKARARWYQGSVDQVDRSEYIHDFIDRMQQLPDDKEAKIMRWLGFIQGWLYATERFDISDLKEHSRLAAEGKIN